MILVKIHLRSDIKLQTYWLKIKEKSNSILLKDQKKLTICIIKYKLRKTYDPTYTELPDFFRHIYQLCDLQDENIIKTLKNI